MAQLLSRNIKLVLALFVLLVLLGIVFWQMQTKRHAGLHTRIHIKDKNVNIWSYSKIYSIRQDSNDLMIVDSFENRAVSGLIEIVLDGGCKIISNRKLSINDIDVEPPVKNIFINSNGSFEKGVYIRTFE
jgi:hypothetical protein